MGSVGAAARRCGSPHPNITHNCYQYFLHQNRHHRRLPRLAASPIFFLALSALLLLGPWREEYKLMMYHGELSKRVTTLVEKLRSESSIFTQITFRKQCQTVAQVPTRLHRHGSSVVDTALTALFVGLRRASRPIRLRTGPADLKKIIPLLQSACATKVRYEASTLSTRPHSPGPPSTPRLNLSLDRRRNRSWSSPQ